MIRWYQVGSNRKENKNQYMSQTKQELLIDHLDRMMEGQNPELTRALLAGDQEMIAEWNYLRISVDAIREAGLREQVATAKRQFEYEQVSAVKPEPVIRRLNYRSALRIAASCMLLAGAAILYKYASTNPENYYNRYYNAYDLSTGRGVARADALEQAYRQKDWASVISMANRLPGKDNKVLFLTGTADMELRKFDDAMLSFQEILDRNKKSGDDYFQDQAEYYLGLSCLANHQAARGIAMLEKIKGDKNHLYYKTVNEMSGLDLSILKYKTAGK
jgi:hypothetical protein